MVNYELSNNSELKIILLYLLNEIRNLITDKLVGNVLETLSFVFNFNNLSFSIKQVKLVHNKQLRADQNCSVFPGLNITNIRLI